MAEPPDPTRGPEITALCIVMMVLSVIAVIFRVWSRLISKNQRFWWGTYILEVVFRTWLELSWKTSLPRDKSCNSVIDLTEALLISRCP